MIYDMEDIVQCLNTIDGEPDGQPCRDEGRLCAGCLSSEMEQWAAYFGQASGTKAQRAAVLEAMRPAMPTNGGW